MLNTVKHLYRHAYSPHYTGSEKLAPSRPNLAGEHLLALLMQCTPYSNRRMLSESCPTEYTC